MKSPRPGPLWSTETVMLTCTMMHLRHDDDPALGRVSREAWWRHAAALLN